MRSPRAALYARVSSEQQAHSRTIASQVASLRERITADGARLEPEHAFLDEGYSGATLLRPALERLRDAVAAGAIDRIYVHSPDRLARRYAYQVLLIEEVRRAGVEIVFLNRPIGGSAEDDLLLQVQGMIAEYERAKILERSRRGRRHAARSGSVSALCAAPFGYRYVGKVAGGGMARFEVIDDEARIVRQIFAWVGLERVSLHEVCRRLAETGCRTRTGLARWDPTTVCGMLRNPAYIGRAAFGRSRFVPPRVRLRPIRGRPWPSRKANTRIPVAREEWIEVLVPALVEPALFAAAQAQLDENRRHRREGRRRPGWLLQGLVVCRRCGYAFYGKMARGKVGGGKKAEYGYYRCLGTDGHRFGGVAPCTNRSVRSDCLELAVWAEIRALLEDPSRLAAEYQRRLDELQQGTGDRASLQATPSRQSALHRPDRSSATGLAELLLCRQIGSSFDLTCPLGGGVDTELGPLFEGQVVQCQSPEDVVHDRLRHSDVWIVSQAGRLELQVAELLHEGFQWHPYCSPMDTAMEKASITPAKVEPCCRASGTPHPGHRPGRNQRSCIPRPRRRRTTWSGSA